MFVPSQTLSKKNHIYVWTCDVVKQAVVHVSVDEMILRKPMLLFFFCIFWGRLNTFGDVVCWQIFNYNLIDCLDTKVKLDKRNRKLS